MRRGDLLPQQAAAILVAFEQLRADSVWGPLTADVLAHAARLLEVHSSAALHTLDAIQLACALAPISEADLFFAHDQRLIGVAQANGLRIV